MNLRRFFCVLFCVAPMLASGCIIKLGGGGSGAGGSSPSAPLLPKPDNVLSDTLSLSGLQMGPIVASPG